MTSLVVLLSACGTQTNPVAGQPVVKPQEVVGTDLKNTQPQRQAEIQ
jgi:pyrimidine deaminase RibD-like protein